MATLTTPLVSVEQYLATMYRPDRDYIDGELKRRNMADIDHSRMQSLLVVALHPLESRYGFRTLTENRIKVNATRFRIADLCLARGTAKFLKILEEPPLLCVEILSPTDRMEEIQERVDDYLAMGVPRVWVLSPRSRRGWIHGPDGVREARDGILRTSDPDLAIPIASLFDEP